MATWAAECHTNSKRTKNIFLNRDSHPISMNLKKNLNNKHTKQKSIYTTNELKSLNKKEVEKWGFKHHSFTK